MWTQEFGSAASGDCWAVRQVLTRSSVLHDSTTRWLQTMTADNMRDVNSGLCFFCLLVVLYRHGWKWLKAPVECLVPERCNTVPVIPPGFSAGPERLPTSQNHIHL